MGFPEKNADILLMSTVVPLAIGPPPCRGAPGRRSGRSGSSNRRAHASPTWPATRGCDSRLPFATRIMNSSIAGRRGGGRLAAARGAGDGPCGAAKPVAGSGSERARVWPPAVFAGQFRAGGAPGRGSCRLPSTTGCRGGSWSRACMCIIGSYRIEHQRSLPQGQGAGSGRSCSQPFCVEWRTICPESVWIHEERTYTYSSTGRGCPTAELLAPASQLLIQPWRGPPSMVLNCGGSAPGGLDAVRRQRRSGALTKCIPEETAGEP
jgi:hypothetical protein